MFSITRIIIQFLRPNGTTFWVAYLKRNELGVYTKFLELQEFGTILYMKTECLGFEGISAKQLKEFIT